MKGAHAFPLAATPRQVQEGPELGLLAQSVERDIAHLGGIARKLPTGTPGQHSSGRTQRGLLGPRPQPSGPPPHTLGAEPHQPPGPQRELLLTLLSLATLPSPRPPA